MKSASNANLAVDGGDEGTPVEVQRNVIDEAAAIVAATGWKATASHDPMAFSHILVEVGPDTLMFTPWFFEEERCNFGVALFADQHDGDLSYQNESWALDVAFSGPIGLALIVTAWLAAAGKTAL